METKKNKRLRKVSKEWLTPIYIYIIQDEIKGEGIFAYIVLKSDSGIADEVEEVKAINKVIQKEIGNIALCDDVVFVTGLPKTRSGKIMRRILRAIFLSPLFMH